MRRKKILVIDDSKTALMLQQMVLQRAYDIVTAKDGPGGIAAAIAERPDLIVLDVVMPLMNGFETCRRLRAEEATRVTPIIMVTSRAHLDQMEEGFRSGCSDYILKPVRGLELLEKIRNCIGE